MPNIASLDRLKSQLLTSGIQEKNQALYQIINQLIDFLRQSIDFADESIIVLTSGVSGILPIGNGGTGSDGPFTSGSIIFVDTSGVFTEDNPNLFWDNINNRLGIGLNAPNSKLEISANTVTPPTAPTATVLRLIGADGANARYTVDCFGSGSPQMVFRHARGTAAPGGQTALLLNDTLGSFIVQGYGATAYVTTNRGNIAFSCNENWTDTAQGSRITFATTPNGSAINGVVRLLISDDGNIAIGNFTPTAGIHIRAGVAAANGAPLKFISGVSLTSPEAGALEFTTDDLFFTITTGAARKGLILDDGARLTSGLMPIASTNGRLIDSSFGVRAFGRQVAQIAAVTTVVTHTVGASDSSFECSANVLVTIATSHNFNVVLAYTDEGNTARTVNFQFQTPTSATSAILNGNGTIPYMGIPIHIRCKAATTIVISTAGVFTTVEYNVEGLIKQTQ